MKILKKYKLEFIIFIASFIFSSWLMFATFSYNNGFFEISTKAWSDFASHIPLIRSFSFGDNFPTQYPLFSGPPIRYHFLFYAFVGLLEKIGLRIDYALNLPSIIGFSSLILMIYVFSKEIFKSRIVGILSIILFLFNGSLSFLKYFSENSISIENLISITNLNKFVSFGSYDGSIVSAFWNLNIYTNQRHLAFSYFMCLFIVYWFIKRNEKLNKNKAVLLGILLGTLFLVNMAVFAIALIILGLFLILFQKNRKYIFISLIIGLVIAIPLYLSMQSNFSTFKPSVHIGYLMDNLKILTFINYWFHNLGLHLIIIPISFFILDKERRKILIPFILLFLVANLFQFSPEIAANHKFLNLFMIVGVMCSAYCLNILWKKNLLAKYLTIILFIFLIFSGVMDIFPIINDKKLLIQDYQHNKNIDWIIRNTKPDSIFLNTNYLYDDASLAGRKVFLGWPYFAWSQGYDTLSRDNLRKSLFSTNNKNFFCKNAKENFIDYVELNLNNNDIIINKQFFDNNFSKVFENKINLLTIYKIGDNCL